MKERQYRIPISRKNLDEIMQFYNVKPTDIIRELGYANPQVWYKNRKEEKFTEFDIDLMAEFLDCDMDWIRGYDCTDSAGIFTVSKDGTLQDISRFGRYHSRKYDSETMERAHEITTHLEKVIDLLAGEYLHITDSDGNQFSYCGYLREIKMNGLLPAVSTDALIECIIEKINQDSSLQYKTMQTMTKKKKKGK